MSRVNWLNFQLKCLNSDLKVTASTCTHALKSFKIFDSEPASEIVTLLVLYISCGSDHDSGLVQVQVQGSS